MDSILETWALKLAEHAVPDEIDLAPTMAEAYAEGGEARAELYRAEQGGGLGGFGAAEAVAIFPWLLKGIALAVPVVSVLIGPGAMVKDVLTMVRDMLTIQDTLIRKRKAQALPNAAMRQALSIITRELHAANLPEEQCELIAFRTLHAFLEDPSGALDFLKKLG